MGNQRLVEAPSAKRNHQTRPCRGRWAVVFLALIAALAASSGSKAAPGASGAARVGSSAPDFTLRLFNGGSVTLSSLKGKPVMVNFWHSA